MLETACFNLPHNEKKRPSWDDLSKWENIMHKLKYYNNAAVLYWINDDMKAKDIGGSE